MIGPSRGRLRSTWFLRLLIFLALVLSHVSAGGAESAGPNKKAIDFVRAGDLACDANKYSLAISNYNRAIGISPKMACAYNNRGIARKKLGDLDGAISDYDHAIKLSPRLAEAYNNRGIARKAKGDLDGAIDDYNLAIKVAPGSPEGFCNRGVARLQKGDLEGATADYDRAIGVYPKGAAAYGHRAWVRYITGKLDEALSDANKSILLKKENYDAISTRGFVRFAKGDIDGARQDLNASIVGFERNGKPLCFYQRGLLKFIERDYQGASNCWRLARILDPSLRKELDPWIHKAQVAERVPKK